MNKQIFSSIDDHQSLLWNYAGLEAAGLVG
jgi:hypothetical protein